jgi:hypothetical protein
LDELLAVYANVRELALQRFPGDSVRAAALFDEQIDQIREFLSRRPRVIQELLRKHFPQRVAETSSP